MTTATTTALPTTAANDEDNDKISQLSFDSLSKPPSSILEDGRFIYLPPVNSSSFFGRSIAKYSLVKAEGGNDDKDGDDDAIGGDKGGSNTHDSKKDGDMDSKSKNNEKEEEVEQIVHPIQIASARIHTHGISELSKVINLSSLIQGNEYFGLTSVVDTRARNKNDAGSKSSINTASSAVASITSSGGDAAKQETNAQNEKNEPNSAANIGNDQNDEEKIITERKLRSRYILKRKQAQFESASSTLSSHYKKLKVITTTQRTIDSRLLQLRKRWRLNVPNHGVHVEYPVQPGDVIAVDVDIYATGRRDDDIMSLMNHSSVMGRIARMVPRFATIELSSDYDIQKQLKQLKHRRQVYHHHHHHHHGQHTEPVKPTTSTEPTKPTTSTEPTKPTTSTEPTKPTTSTEPTKPTTSTEPTKPTTSTETTKPTTSTVPTKPTTSTEPAQSHENETEVKKQVDEENLEPNNTIAQPFLITESLSNKNLQLDDDTNNIPMLTLLFQIEKSSTGYVQSVSLSSNILSSSSSLSSSTSHVNESATNSDDVMIDEESKVNQQEDQQIKKDSQNITKTIIQNKIQLQNDELLIQSLQHSLFCANVFDSIRQEIIHDQQQTQQQTQQQQGGSGANNIKRKKASMGTSGNKMMSANSAPRQNIAWLSSEMEESFLPPPSLMAGKVNHGNSQNNNDDDEEMLNNDNPNFPLSVIYCHEGEVKVQLDSEYSLMIKLVDVNNHDSDDTINKTMNSNNSGSQSPEQLHILCRLLLLQAQLVYHNNRKEQLQKLDDAIQAEKDDTSTSIDYSAGIYSRGSTSMKNNMALMRQNKKLQSSLKAPHILQLCVGLGTKVILERKVRKAMLRLAVWQKKKNLKVANRFNVEWLPSSIFDAQSRFALSLNPNNALDVNIFDNKISVSSFGEDGGFRIAHFGTSEQFELFVKNEILRMERN